MTNDNVWLYSILAAALPVLFFVVLIYWVDRYEKEPWWLLSAAFLWGAIPSVILALVFNALFSVPFYLVADTATADTVAGSAIAPVVEESAKAVILFAILFFWRHELDSPLDGIIYGAMVGMGFAMVENAVYYQQAFIGDGPEGWNALVLMRGVIFGLNHALYASMTGLGIALARMSRSWLVKLAAPLLGLACAIVLHAFHNFTMLSNSFVAFLTGVTSDWGGIILIVLIMILALQQERRWLRDYLKEETELGLVPPQHYGLVVTAAGRNRHRVGLLAQQGLSAYRHSGRLFHRYSELAYRKHHFELFADERSAEAIERLRREIAELSAIESDLG